MERDQLAQLLDDSDRATGACRKALLDGAEFIVWDGAGPAAQMLPAYERREAQALASGTATIGFAEALSALRAAGTRSVRLGQVTVASPPFVYLVFLTDEPVGVLACLGIDQDRRPLWRDTSAA